ncbi:MAG: hypothetical protein FWF56_05180 [Firmicutes bacterium]|nr:hypothetical protein [Bacillota bacterium]MCL1953374.1 hypothetical protein [Bacillota bacterium]
MKKNNCNTKTPNKTSNKPNIEHSLKNCSGVTGKIVERSIADTNTNDTGMRHQ